MTSQIAEEVWESQRVDTIGPLLLHELFEKQVQLTPDAVALITEEREWSYRDLNERANQLAHFLLEKGDGARRSDRA